MSDKYDVMVLGAGAAGLTAGMQAAGQGCRVAVLDRARVAGSKVRIAGGGRGNVTNRIMGPEWFVGAHPQCCRTILKAYGTQQALDMLQHFGMQLEEREAGQLFCLSPAARLVEAMVERSMALGVDMLLDCPLRAVEDDGPGFAVHLEDGRCLRTARLVVALGSPAWPQIGASDMGLRLARQWGHRLVPVQPVLAPLIMPEGWPLHGLEGISVDVSVHVCGRRFVQPLLFTHKGLSGPAALQASCIWQTERVRSPEQGAEHGADAPPAPALSINFLPGITVRELMHMPEHGKLLVRTLMSRYLPARLAERLVPEPVAGRKVAEIGKRERAALHAAVHEHTVTPLRTEGLSKAEAAAGGVDTTELCPRTLESRKRPGLYFAGEVMDVTGLLGGYNLHWAWASGTAAGHAAGSGGKLASQ